MSKCHHSPWNHHRTIFPAQEPCLSSSFWVWTTVWTGAILATLQSFVGIQRLQGWEAVRRVLLCFPVTACCCGNFRVKGAGRPWLTALEPGNMKRYSIWVRLFFSVYGSWEGSTDIAWVSRQISNVTLSISVTGCLSCGQRREWSGAKGARMRAARPNKTQCGNSFKPEPSRFSAQSWAPETPKTRRSEAAGCSRRWNGRNMSFWTGWSPPLSPTFSSPPRWI